MTKIGHPDGIDCKFFRKVMSVMKEKINYEAPVLNMCDYIFQPIANGFADESAPDIVVDDMFGD